MHRTVKYIIFTFLIFPILSLAQIDGNWHHLDPKENNILGISSYKAYELLKNKTPDTIIVAILDNGCMINHEDLKDVIWINEDEIPNNGIDDDSNGYVDDIHGWNFLGNKEGKNLKMDMTSLTRMYKALANDSSTELSTNSSRTAPFHSDEKIKEAFEQKREEKMAELTIAKENDAFIKEGLRVLRACVNKVEIDSTDLANFTPRNKEEAQAKKACTFVINTKISEDYFANRARLIQKELDTRLNPNFNNREKIVGDDPNNINDTDYGNSMVWARGPSHGTGVASVVGALDNQLGYSGIAQHVKLIILRVVPNGDERDKDVALAIQYAVDNGAKIINCSFGKPYSSNWIFVSKAIAYAESHDVLIVKGSGNSSLNVDSTHYFPKSLKSDYTPANNLITVGASSYYDNKSLLAYFSNYGQENVEVLAPGIAVGSCDLQNKYTLASGTSIASPVVSGVAAVLMAYYPHLSAAQVREIIMQSVYIPKTKKVYKPTLDRNKKESVKIKNMCATGGIVNLYQAILLVEEKYLPGPAEE